jgi:hypothetical protein
MLPYFLEFKIESKARFALIINLCLMHKQRKSSMMHQFMCFYLVFIGKKIYLMNKPHIQKSSFIISNNKSHGYFILGFTDQPGVGWFLKRG